MQFVKLGGSLITDKKTPYTLNREILERLCQEISRFVNENPEEQLVIGHGSGSFGHIPAQKYGTRQGVATQTEWQGFHEVWREARLLHLLVMEALFSQGIRAISFSPSATIFAARGIIRTWNLEPLRSALQHGMIPVVYGDVVFDAEIGGTILSTEELFQSLSLQLCPNRILLAGIEQGIWADFPERRQFVSQITPASFPDIKNSLQGSGSPDVTGGMITKVESMLSLTAVLPDLEVQIFNGLQRDSLYETLQGHKVGTIIKHHA